MSVTSTDPIADMLTRIRNAINVRKNEIIVPHSRIKESVAKLLVKNNFLDDVKVEKAAVGKALHIVINPSDQNARITEIARMSKPGRRHYASADEIPTIKSGRGIVVISTSKGVMSGNEAKSKRLGGEVICKVY